jgi:hypothetical protein
LDEEGDVTFFEGIFLEIRSRAAAILLSEVSFTGTDSRYPAKSIRCVSVTL